MAATADAVNAALLAEPSPLHVTQLVLDQLPISTLSSVLSSGSKSRGLNDFCNLVELSLVDCQCRSLTHFPSLRKLKRLNLSENPLTSTLDALMSAPQLQHLDLSHTAITLVESLLPLNELESLKHLRLTGTPLANENDNYRDAVFRLLPRLVTVDGQDKQGRQVDSDDDVQHGYGKQRGPVSEEDEEEDEEDEEDEEEENYSVPVSRRFKGKGKGSLNVARKRVEELSDDDEEDEEPGLSYLQESIASSDDEDASDFNDTEGVTANDEIIDESEDEEDDQDEEDLEDESELDESSSDANPGLAYLLRRPEELSDSDENDNFTPDAQDNEEDDDLLEEAEEEDGEDAFHASNENEWGASNQKRRRV